MDPVTTISGGVTIGQCSLQTLNDIRGVRGSGVISALFDSEGVRISGRDVVKVIRHASEGRKDLWWFQVQEVKDYAFMRFPVVDVRIRIAELHPD